MARQGPPFAISRSASSSLACAPPEAAPGAGVVDDNVELTGAMPALLNVELRAVTRFRRIPALFTRMSLWITR
jgi:hypothetical protein